jgi:hypothetical protein
MEMLFELTDARIRDGAGPRFQDTFWRDPAKLSQRRLRGSVDAHIGGLGVIRQTALPLPATR